jgi:hypothetical protein
MMTGIGTPNSHNSIPRPITSPSHRSGELYRPTFHNHNVACKRMFRRQFLFRPEIS